MHALDDIHNELDTDVLSKFEETPEYLATAFQAYAKQEKEK